MQAIPRQVVIWRHSGYGRGSVVVSTTERRLYYVLGNGQAIEYGVGIGRQGFTWSGTKTVSRKREWPDWRPPAQMLKRRPDLPKHMEGGMENPLGARAIFQKASAKILPHLHIEIVKRSDQAKGFELEWLSSGPHCQKDRKVSWAAPPRQSLVRPIQHRAHRRVGAYSQVAPICASHKPRHHRSCFGLASWALADILVER